MNSVLFAFLLMPWAAAWQDPAPMTEASASSASEQLLHGSLSMRYRGRTRGGFDDHDLISTFALDVGDARRRGWSGHLLADGLADLDGHEGSGAPFSSLGDTHTSALLLRVYEAHADLRGSDEASLLRVGRQSDGDTPVQLWYDGLRVEQRVAGRSELHIGMFGGRSVRFYDDAGAGDLVVGAFATLRPWHSARARVDWLRLEDDAQLGAGNDTLVALSVRQGVLGRGSVRGAATWLGGQTRDATVSATWSEPGADLLVEVRGYQLFNEQNQLALELDPFTSVLLAEQPYREAQVFASKGLGRTVRVDAGFQKRTLENAADEGEFNHGFERAHATLSLTDVLPAGLRLSVSGERWNSSTNDVATWGADVSKVVAERLEASVGSAYLLYKTDLVAVSESDDVRTWYARLKSRPREGVSWDVRYEYDDDGAGTSTLRLGATWRF